MEKSKLSFLGLVKRANALVAGDRMMEGIRNKSVYCVLLTTAASPRTQKQIRDKCAFYTIPLIDGIEQAELHAAIGEVFVAVGITNSQMAAKILHEMR